MHQKKLFMMFLRHARGNLQRVKLQQNPIERNDKKLFFYVETYKNKNNKNCAIEFFAPVLILRSITIQNVYCNIKEKSTRFFTQGMSSASLVQLT